MKNSSIHGGVEDWEQFFVEKSQRRREKERQARRHRRIARVITAIILGAIIVGGIIVEMRRENPVSWLS